MITIHLQTGIRHVTPQRRTKVVTIIGAVGNLSYRNPYARLPVIPPAPSHVNTVEILSMSVPVIICSSIRVGPYIFLHNACKAWCNSCILMTGVSIPSKHAYYNFCLYSIFIQLITIKNSRLAFDGCIRFRQCDPLSALRTNLTS